MFETYISRYSLQVCSFTVYFFPGVKLYTFEVLDIKHTTLLFNCSEVTESEIASSSNSKELLPPPSVTLVKKQFGGRYAISSEEFTIDMVGYPSYLD